MRIYPFASYSIKRTVHTVLAFPILSIPEFAEGYAQGMKVNFQILDLVGSSLEGSPT